jgi:sortase (surface protein transpeptidase)
MTKQLKKTSSKPVIGRFAQIRELWLGLLQAKPVQQAKRHRCFPIKASLKWLPKKLVNGALNALIVSGFILGLVWFGPKLYFTVFSPKVDQAQAEELAGDFELKIDEEQLTERSEAPPSQRNFQPPYNDNLPEGDWLMIPRIGVRSTLQPTEQYEDALETGLWLAPSFGRPGDQDQPMIVAGHRFGFRWWWEDDYWKFHSFYLLPRLEPGDKVEVIANKRKYVYEIYAGEEGTEITDYRADLILYTCKHLDSPIRIFRYAKLLSPEGQATPLSNL